MNILVTGATGTVGGHLTQLLAGRGHQVRVLVRDRVRGSFPAGIDVAEGDLTNPDDLRPALAGIDRAFLNMADDNGAHFATVAGEAGLGHVLLLSSFTVTIPLPSGDANIITARHRAGERALAEAGVPATFLRPAGFDSNILMWTRGLRDGVIRAPYPDVRLPIVHPGDIAASAAALLLDDASRTGAFTITGPERLSVRDQAGVLSELLVRDIRVERISEDEATRTSFPEGTPEPVSTSILETMGDSAGALEPSADVETLTGRAPRAFRDWARENLASFH